MAVLIIFFLFGLFIGSFLNCVIHRLWYEGSFLQGRSYCPKCKHKLNWYDLIPVLSLLILKRKCRYCGKKISWQYPIVEIGTGILFVSLFHFQIISPQLTISFFVDACLLLLIFCFLIIIFVYDLKHYIIPDRVVYPAILISGIWHLIFKRCDILNALYAALGAFLFFLLIFLISKGKWIGFGDVKLVFFMGILIGFPNILAALFSAFLIGAIIGIGLILFGKKGLKSEIPFGPFLVTGTIIAMFFGHNLINWYLNLFI